MILIGIVPIIILIIFLMKKRGGQIGIFGLIIMSGALITFSEVDAKLVDIIVTKDLFNPCTETELNTGYCTINCCGGRCMTKFDSGACPSRGNKAKANVTLNATTYNPGDTITVSATEGAFSAKCANLMGVNVHAALRSKNKIDNKYKWYSGWNEVLTYLGRASITDKNKDNEHDTGYVWWSAMDGDTIKTTELKVPTQCGNYVVPVRLQFTHGGTEFITRYTYFDFSVNCYSSTLSAANPTCAVSEIDDPVDGRGTVDLTLTSVDLSDVRYAFKCGGGSGENWTDWKTERTHTCQFDEPGTYAVRGKIGRMIDGSVGSPLSATAFQDIVIDECPVPGACMSESLYTYEATVTNWPETVSTYFCEKGTPTFTPTQANFPGYGDIKTWGCSGVGGEQATLDDACSAKHLAPSAMCGTQHPNKSTDVTPPLESYSLCGTDCSKVEIPTLGTNGKWSWECKHKELAADPITVECEAPSCLIDMPINLQKYVYFDSDGNPKDASISVKNGCAVCCKIDGNITDVNKEQENIICTGEKGWLKLTNSGSSSYEARCWLNGGTNCEIEGNCPEVIYDLPVDTMCTARECSAGGTCQATPQAADAPNKCKSSCNSNADCSRGRIIETRP